MKKQLFILTAAALVGVFVATTSFAQSAEQSDENPKPAEVKADKKVSEHIRNDISINEIYDLKGCSAEEIIRKLGEPHGSVSGGSFQQFHYILENGDIVIFSASALNNGHQQFSIYDKNGELKNDNTLNNIHKDENLTEEQIQKLDELMQKADVTGRFLYQEKLITGEIDPNTPKLDLTTAKKIIADSDAFEEILSEFEKVQKYPDYIYGSGLSIREYWFDKSGYEKISIIVEQGDIAYESFNADGELIYCEELF